jgi:hypothetical protein
LDDRLIQIRPGNLKAIADALDLSSNYGQTSNAILPPSSVLSKR